MAAKKPNFLQRLRKGLGYAFSYGNGYDATKSTRYRERKRIHGGVQSEERELPQGDRLSLITLLLDQRRNNPVVRAICRLREEDVVGRGLQPRPQTGDRGLDEELTARWLEYSDSPEVSGCSMMETQRLLASMPLIHGDGGLLLLENGQVQLVAGEQIGEAMPSAIEQYSPKETSSKPYICEGVELDKYGKPAAYHIGYQKDGKLTDPRRVDAANFIHHAKRLRVGQVRGVPELATSVDTLLDIAEYERIEMLAAKVAATMAAVVKKDASLDFEIGSRADEEERLEYFESGRFHYLEPSEDVSVISPNGRPNVNSIDWLIYKLRIAGSTVGIPVEYLLMTIGETSFSASQGMVLLYQNTVEAEQRILQQTLGKWYRWWIAQQIRTGDLKPPQGALLNRCTWQGPAFRWINRSSQVQADQLYLQMGAISLEQVTAQYGMVPFDVMTAKAKEIALAKEIAAANDLDHWRDLFNPIVTYGNYVYDRLREDASDQVTKQDENNPLIPKEEKTDA